MRSTGNRRAPSRLAAALIGALTTILLLPAGPAQATFPGSNGKIVFQSMRDGNPEIYTMNANGTAQTRLTNNTFGDEHPKWSPDGTKIVFESTRDGNREIYTMNANGTAQTRITNNVASDEFPAWSGDGTKIVFDSDRDDPLAEIYTMNANGTGVVRLTNNPAFDFAAVWSPNGSRIAWMSSRGSSSMDIWAMDSNGANPQLHVDYVGRDGARDEFPSWPPDGNASQMILNTNLNGNFDLMRANLQGITQEIGNNVAGSDAPDGSDSHVSHTDRYGNNDIFVYTTSSQRLTTGSADDSFADWQPLQIPHGRPISATPVKVSLVPAYKACSDPNTTHTPPIALPSCVSPRPGSAYLTVGTPELNAQPVGFTGSVSFAVNLSPADGRVSVRVTDVRCAGTSGGCDGGALADYTGSLQARVGFRITDRRNGSGTRSGTVQDTTLTFPVACATTTSAAIGSTCEVNTTINTILGGGITAGQRAIWQLAGNGVEILDGGADGSGVTAGGNTLYAAGGLFFP